MTVNELDSRVAVVHRCFSERGDSILSVFSWEPLRAKLHWDIDIIDLRKSIISRVLLIISNELQLTSFSG